MSNENKAWRKELTRCALNSYFQGLPLVVAKKAPPFRAVMNEERWVDGLFYQVDLLGRWIKQVHGQPKRGLRWK